MNGLIIKTATYSNHDGLYLNEVDKGKYVLLIHHNNGSMTTHNLVKN